MRCWPWTLYEDIAPDSCEDLNKTNEDDFYYQDECDDFQEDSLQKESQEDNPKVDLQCSDNLDDCGTMYDCQDGESSPQACFQDSSQADILRQSYVKSQKKPLPLRAQLKTRGGTFVLLFIFQFMVLTTAAEVTISPPRAVAGLKSTAVFSCHSLTPVESVEWLINDTSLNDLQLSGVTQEFTITIRFSNVQAEYNNTRIQCRADSVLSSDASILLVQGLLSAVNHLSVNFSMDHIYVNWTAPFTLDITFSSVDITYCVDVVSSTTSATLHSECGVNVTEFTYPLPPRSWCHEYNFTVTPVNTAGNGTTRSIFRSQPFSGLEFVEMTSINFTHRTLHLSSPVCEAELRFVDVDTAEIITLEDTDVTITETNITFSAQQLRENRHYAVTITASNSVGSFESNIEISTHDITSCVTVEGANSITVVVNFTEFASATGALLNFIFINEDGITVDFSKSICKTVTKSNISQGLTLPLNMWYPGRYMLYAYDIESDKRIMDGIGYQASNGPLIVPGQVRTLPPPDGTGCTINIQDGEITVLCNYTSFQALAQLNSQDDVSILHVNTSMDSHTPVILQVTENGEYLVTVLPIQDQSGIILNDPFAETVLVTNAQTTEDSSDLSLGPTTSVTETSVALIGAVVGVVTGSVLLILVSGMAIIISSKYKKRAKVKIEVQLTRRGRTASMMHHYEDHHKESTHFEDHGEADYAMVHDVNSHMHTSMASNDHPLICLESPDPPADAANDATTPLSAEGNFSSTSHYVALDHPAKPVSSDDEVTNIHSIQYAIPKGYKNKHNQTYAFVDLKESSDKGCVFELSKGIGDDIVYSEVVQLPKKKFEESGRTSGNLEQDQEQRQPIQDERSCGDVTPFLDNNFSTGAVIQRFPWTAHCY